MHAAAQPPARSTRFFFAVTFVITWLLQLPAVLALYHVIPGPPERYMAFVGLGAFGPLLGAMWASRRDRAYPLFAPLRIWRVSMPWYVIALLLPGAIFTTGMAVRALLGFADAGPWAYVPTSAPRWIALVVFPLGEEFGWRGFALPRLWDRHGPLRASVIVGVMWGLWHVPMFLLSGITPTQFALMGPFFVAGSVVFTWLYGHTRGSMLLAVLMHMGAHLDNSNVPLPANATPLVVHTIGYCVVALLLVVVDRAVWQRETPLAPISRQSLV